MTCAINWEELSSYVSQYFSNSHPSSSQVDKETMLVSLLVFQVARCTYQWHNPFQHFVETVIGLVVAFSIYSLRNRFKLKTPKWFWLLALFISFFVIWVRAPNHHSD